MSQCDYNRRPTEARNAAGDYVAVSRRTGKIMDGRKLPEIEAVTRYVTNATYFGGDARHQEPSRVPVSVARVRWLEREN